MVDPALLALVTSVGTAAGVGIGKVWSWYRERAKARWERSVEVEGREDLAKDQLISALGAELGHERAERARERQEAKETISRLGARLDETKAMLERERLQAAGVAVRMRMDSQVDETEFEPGMPAAVRDRADLIAPTTASTPPVHPESERALHDYAHPDKATTLPAPPAKPGAYRGKMPTLRDGEAAPVPPRPDRGKPLPRKGQPP